MYSFVIRLRSVWHSLRAVPIFCLSFFRDLVVLFEDGNFQVVGRIKDMIIRGGENIFPREIEDFLHTHPSIVDVHVCMMNVNEVVHYLFVECVVDTS